MKQFTVRRGVVGALFAAVAGVGFVSAASGATDTWTGAISDPLSGPASTYKSTYFNPLMPLYKWDATTANWSNGGTNTYTVGDNVVFTDNFTGGTDITVSTGNLNPATVTFSHIAGSTPTTYTIYRSSGTPPDFTLADGTTTVAANSPFGASETGAVLTLDTGFLGRVVIRPRASNTNLSGGIVIKSGTLEIHDQGPGPGGTNQNNTPYTLAGGTLDIYVDTATNSQPASSGLSGPMSVLADSTLELGRPVTSNGTTLTGTPVGSRVYNGAITVAAGATLTLVTDNAGIQYNLGANISASAGTFKLVDGTGGQTVVSLQNGTQGSPTSTFDLGNGTSVLTNNQGSGKQIDIGALLGGSNTALKGTSTSASAGNSQTVSIGAAGLNATFNGIITDGTGATPMPIAVTKVGAGVQRLNGANTYTGVTTVKAGALVVNTAASNVILNGAGANIQGGDLAFDYTGGSSPATAIRTILAGEAASNFATGKLASSTAAADATHLTVLGYADAADVGLSVGTSNAVVVKYTYVGDGSLDGKVDLGNDFSLFLEGYLKPSLLTDSNSWALGDYNYDGVVNNTDFGLFIDGFKGQGGSLGDLAGVIESSSLLSGAQKAQFLSVVPEPTMLGATALAGLAMLGRRRRK
jgi:autotransporter-associated beta strand protein